MDPRSSPEKEGPSSPAREAGPGHSDTPNSVISNTMPGDNQGNQQNVVGDHNIPIMNMPGGHMNVNIYNSPAKKLKTTSEKKLSAEHLYRYKNWILESKTSQLRI